MVGERSPMKEMRDEPSVLRVPQASSLIRLAEGRIVKPRSRIKLIVEENLKPENPTAASRLKRLLDRRRTQVRRQQLEGCRLAHARVHR
jgi:hypothetical protein